MAEVKLTEEARALTRDLRHQVTVSAAHQAQLAAPLQGILGEAGATALGAARTAIEGVAEPTVDALERADQALSQELSDNTPLLEARDDAARAVADALIRLRLLITSVLGEDAAESYSLVGATPQEPRRLRDKAAQVLHLLTEKPQTVEDALGGRFDSTQARAALAGLADTLKDTIQAVDADNLEDSAARRVRDEALADAVRLERAMRLIGEAACVLGDANDLIRQLARPSRRATGGITPNQPEPDGSTPRPDEPTEPEGGAPVADG